jgi:flavin-dependent dehydrogenase
MAHIPKFYDVVIIGAGPAGLSAACTTRRLGLDTLLLEQLPQSGELGHPCGSTIAPVPGFVAGERRQDGLHYPELDLTIPSSLLIGFPTTQRYISPGGYEMRVVFPARDDFPIAAVDKPGLLRLLAEQAIGAGVELCFGTVVTGLIAEGNRIVGVRTEAEEIRAQIILSAEGTTRRFCQEAGLYDAAPPTRCHVAIVWQELEAPGVRDEHVGKIATFGERYTSATRVVGTVDMPAAGYAAVYLSFFGTGPYEGNEELSWDYLEEYKRTDPRVQDLLVGSTVVRRRRCRLVVRDAPPRVVQAGFMGLGDAVTPGGRLGIVPSL